MNRTGLNTKNNNVEEVPVHHEFILGKRFINNKNEEIFLEEIQKAHLVFLFFTGLWCSPCQEFAEELLKFYQKVNESMKTLEVIHISFDRSEEEFKKDIADKPWVFIPYNDPVIKDITNKFSVHCVPTILLINKDCTVVSDTVRKDIIEQGIRIVDKWIKLVNNRQN